MKMFSVPGTHVGSTQRLGWDTLHMGQESSYSLWSPQRIDPNKVKERKEWETLIHRNAINMILVVHTCGC